MPDDELLDSVMMHWIQGPTPGFRYYKATFGEKGQKGGAFDSFTYYVSIPAGVSIFPKEFFQLSKDWADKVVNIKFWREHKAGGHFPSQECPETLIGDLREWFGSRTAKEAMKRESSHL